jgi:short subunit dehydrogenase-like uncharacterized protein
MLAGWDERKPRDAADGIGGNARVVVAESIEDIAGRIARSAATVVVNTIGPFTQTAIARACPRGCKYVDISNELDAVIRRPGLPERQCGLFSVTTTCSAMSR